MQSASSRRDRQIEIGILIFGLIGLVVFGGRELFFPDDYVTYTEVIPRLVSARVSMDYDGGDVMAEAFAAYRKLDICKHTISEFHVSNDLGRLTVWAKGKCAF